MAERPPNMKELGYYITLAQVSLEMVAPLVVGIALDYYFDWTPWATVGGAILGFVGGLAHLIALANRQDGGGPSQPRGEGE